jgi:general secretion pathway protein C
MSARWWTVGVWALAAGSGLYWGLLVFVKPPPAPAHTQTAAVTPALNGDLTRLLGSDPPPPPPEAMQAEAPADARFQLIGVVSPPSRQAAREGVALIAVDGKPAKAFRVGAVVEGDNVLQTVAARGVTLGPRNGPALVALNLPPPTPAATGTLPNMGGEFAPPARLAPGVRGPGAAPRAVPPTMPSPGRQPGQPMPEPEAQENAEVINQADNLPVR